MKNKKKSVKIISGKWRGKKIPIFIEKNLRPTLSRIKETLFNWISKDIYNSNCLDCFSGTGSLSIEALSREAKSATLLEIKRKTYFQIKKNFLKLNIKNAKIINTNTTIYLKKIGIPHNIIFINPPFYKNLLSKTIFLLENNNWLSNLSLIYIQTEEKKFFKILPKNWKLYRTKKMKNFSCYLFIRKKTNKQ